MRTNRLTRPNPTPDLSRNATFLGYQPVEEVCGTDFLVCQRASLAQEDRLESRSHKRIEFFNRLLDLQRPAPSVKPAPSGTGPRDATHRLPLPRPQHEPRVIIDQRSASHTRRELLLRRFAGRRRALRRREVVGHRTRTPHLSVERHMGRRGLIEVDLAHHR